jgi:hypothetical protein
MGFCGTSSCATKLAQTGCPWQLRMYLFPSRKCHMPCSAPPISTLFSECVRRARPNIRQDAVPHLCTLNQRNQRIRWVGSASPVRSSTVWHSTDRHTNFKDSSCKPFSSPFLPAGNEISFINMLKWVFNLTDCQSAGGGGLLLGLCLVPYFAVEHAGCRVHSLKFM